MNDEGFGQDLSCRNGGKYCVIVPAYQEEKRIGVVVRGVRKQCVDVVVIDDGSTDSTAKEAEEAGAVVVRHDRNMGKGVALNSGFEYARKRGFDAVITMDADGQHDPADILHFIEEYRRTRPSALVGNRMGSTSAMPFVRRLTNRFMSRLLSRRMGQEVPDTQSGFRLYAREVIPLVIAESQRYAAESEVLLRLAEEGVQIGAVPVKVIYRDEKSRINPFVDALRFLSMLRRHKRRKKDNSAAVGDVMGGRNS